MCLPVVGRFDRTQIAFPIKHIWSKLIIFKNEKHKPGAASVYNSIMNTASSAEIHHVIRRTPVIF